MAERKLASIQRITELVNIPNADSIVCATVLGWHVVVKKDEFKVGDLVVYFEVDSLLPIIPEFEFLAKYGISKSYIGNNEYAGYRLRTAKLRGQVSQGLCLPLSILSGKIYESDTRENPHYVFSEGQDVSSLLGVVKYEPSLPANLSGVAKSVFPEYIPKTDEPRLQAFPQIIERYKGVKFYTTEKVDGASCTIFIDSGGKLNVCSRTLNLLESDKNTYWKTAKELDLENKLKNNGATNIALQGELIGSNIQGNKLGLSGHTILFFNAYDMAAEKYLDFEDFMALCEKLKLETVPILDENYSLPDTVDGVVEYATRKSTIADIWAEGVVFRPLVEIYDEDLGRLSFKCINPEFLLKYKDD